MRRDGHGDMWLEHVYLQVISAYYRTGVNTATVDQVNHARVKGAWRAARAHNDSRFTLCPPPIRRFEKHLSPFPLAPSFAFVRARAANARDAYRRAESHKVVPKIIANANISCRSSLSIILSRVFHCVFFRYYYLMINILLIYYK